MSNSVNPVKNDLTKSRLYRIVRINMIFVQVGWTFNI